MDSDWNERMIGDMVIAGLSAHTREAYSRAVRHLVQFYHGQAPDKAYLRWMRVEKEAAPGTLRIAIGGLRFFYHHISPRDWAVLRKCLCAQARLVAG